MDEQSTLFLYEADAEPVLASLDEIDAALTALDDEITQVAGAADSLATLDDAFASLADALTQDEELFAGLTTAIGEATAAGDDLASVLAGMADDPAIFDDLSVAASAVATGLEEVAAAGSALGTEIAAGAEEAAGAMDGLAASETAAKDEAAGGFGNAQMGAMLLVGAIGMAGKGFLDLGMQAEDSLHRVEGAAGVSQQQMAAMMPALEKDATDFGDTMKQVGDALYFVESAGFDAAHGGLDVERQALEASSASGADFQTVAQALTSELHAYGAGAAQAKQYTDDMSEGVIQGAQSFQDFAGAIGPLASIGHATGLSFKEVVAAEATMTQINPHVRQDGMQLQAMFKALGLNIDQTAATAKKLGLSFNEAHYKSLDLIGRLQYLQSISKGNMTDFTKLVGGANGLQAALDLLSKKGTVYGSTLKAMKDDTGATDQMFARTSDTISHHAAQVGASLSILSTHLVEMAAPYIEQALSGLASVFSGMTAFITQHGQQAIPIILSLAAALGGALLAAALAIVGPMIAAAAPFIAIGAAIGGVVALVVLFVTHWNQISAAVMNSPLGPVLRFLGQVFHDLATFIAANFVPVFRSLQQVWQNQILPAAQAIMAALNQLKPVFQFIAMLVGTVLFTAFATFVGVLSGVGLAIANIVHDIGSAIGGIVEIIRGIFQVIGGIVQFFVDLLTGHFDKLKGDIGQIFAGLGHIVGGFFQTLGSLVHGVFGTIGAFISGFAQGVVGVFGHLFATLTGQVDDTKTKVDLKMAEMKLSSITHTQEMAQKTVANLDKERQGILKQLENCKSESERKRLEMKLKAVTLAEEQQKAVVQKAQQEKEQTLKHIAELKQKYIDEHKNMFQKAWDAVSQGVGHIFDLIGTFVHNLIMKAEQMRQQFIDKAEQLRAQFVQHVQDLINQAISFFQSLPGRAVKIIQDMITGLANAITNGIGTVVNAAKNLGTNIANTIKNFLHFSIPDEGPLRDIESWMPDMMTVLASGITANQGKLRAALTGATSGLSSVLQAQVSAAPGLPSPTALAPAPQLSAFGLGGAGLGDNQQTINLLAQILAALVAQQGGNISTSINMANTIHAPGVSDAQQLFAQLQALGGYQYGQSLQRGAFGL